MLESGGHRAYLLDFCLQRFNGLADKVALFIICQLLKLFCLCLSIFSPSEFSFLHAAAKQAVNVRSICRVDSHAKLHE